MNDIDSLPDLYETLIDGPAFIYDSFSNLNHSLIKNQTLFCLFFIEQFNSTNEQCEHLLNYSIMNNRQVRRKILNIFRFMLFNKKKI